MFFGGGAYGALFAFTFIDVKGNPGQRVCANAANIFVVFAKRLLALLIPTSVYNDSLLAKRSKDWKVDV